MTKPKAKHTHKYRKINIGKEKKYEVFRCEIPNCTHYLPVKMAEGKVCLCNRCGNVMSLDKEAIQLARPHCKDCIIRKKETVNDNSLSELLDKIIP